MTSGDIGALTVLVVDDDSFQRRMIEKILTTIGVGAILSAESAQRALEVMDAPEPGVDAFVCDLDMPGMDGMEFLRRISEKGFEGSVIILSGTNANILHSVVLMARAYGLKTLGALAKPATPEALRTLLLRHWTHTEKRTRVAEAVISTAEIRAGLDSDEFEPFFQPQVNLRTGRVCGAEVLARWRHPVRGVLAPSAFIGPIEQTGQMDRLTWAMLEKSAARWRRWRDAGLDISISVNLSLSSLQDTHLSNRLLDIVSILGIKPSEMIFEVTETIAMTDIAHCLETLSRLRMKGFGLSIDDFGTGFSSLQQLSRIPFTELKIDQSFISGASTEPRQRSVIESSIQLAKDLGLKTVGEGIEAREDMLYLRRAGCEIGQGYFISKPMAGEDFLSWIKEWERTPLL